MQVLYLQLVEHSQTVEVRLPCLELEPTAEVLILGRLKVVQVEQEQLHRVAKLHARPYL